MSSSSKNKGFAQNAEVVTFRYRGPDRRDDSANPDDSEISREVRYDEKGNPILDVRTNVPRRRKDDDTLDLVKRLDDGSLDLEIDED